MKKEMELQDKEPKLRRINIVGKDITIAKIAKKIEEPKIFNLKAVIKKTPR